MTIGIFEGMGHLSLIVTILVVVGIFCYLWYLFMDGCAKEDKQNTQKPNYYHYEPKREEPKQEEPKREIKEETKVHDYTPPRKETEFPHINERREPSPLNERRESSYKNSPPDYHIRERISYGFAAPKKETTYSHSNEQTEAVKEQSYTPLFTQEEINRLREEPKKSLIIPYTSSPPKKKAYIPPPLSPPTLKYSVDITGKRNITDNKILLCLLDTIGFETVEKMSPKTTIIVNAMKTSIITTKYGGKTKHTSLFSTVRTTRENLISLYHSDEAKAHERNKMTASLRQKIMIRDNYTCQMCGKVMRDTVGLQIDHIIPINKGGKSVEENLQVLCSICNGRKSDKILGG